nr:MAG TPA: N BRO family, N-terminal domain [Caudoviricetes sp.]
MQELSLSSTQIEISNFQTFTTEYVAEHYGVDVPAIIKHKQRHTDEIVENIHFVYFYENTKGGKQEILKWTLRGIIKLGMFIRSPQAKNFRLWAEAELERSIKNLEAKAAASWDVIYVDYAHAVSQKQLNTFRSFVRDALVADDCSLIPTAYLYEVYSQYVALEGGKPLTITRFHPLLKKEMARQGAAISRGRKRLQIKNDFLSDKPRCVCGIKFSPKMSLCELVVNGERIPVSEMSFIASPSNRSRYGAKSLLLSLPQSDSMLSDDRQEELIRQNERLNLENKRLKKALFREKAKKENP